MAEKWTKTSSPVWRVMKPKPLASLNHFTVPCSMLLNTFKFLEFTLAIIGGLLEAETLNRETLTTDFYKREHIIHRNVSLLPLLAHAKNCRSSPRLRAFARIQAAFDRPSSAS